MSLPVRVRGPEVALLAVAVALDAAAVALVTAAKTAEAPRIGILKRGKVERVSCREEVGAGREGLARYTG